MHRAVIAFWWLQLAFFTPFLLFHSHPPATMLKHKHLNKSEDENVREQKEKNRAREAILFLFSSESGTVCHFHFFFHIYSTDLSSVADHTPLFSQQFLVINHKWLLGKAVNVIFKVCNWLGKSYKRYQQLFSTGSRSRVWNHWLHYIYVL